ncbi:hypothetical protein C0991_007280 [Blastosporella zonata]|nr:hypothetical protein C0991_007280 [Blastosporella zonata]
MMRPLQPGEVGVSFLSDGGEREILPESELILVDRNIHPGDFCKRTIEHMQSGVVTNVHVKGRIEHVISGEPVEGWKTMEDIETKLEADIGDYVVYDDWIGQVIELFDESLIETSNGQLVRLPELSSRLHVGERGSDIIPLPTGSMYNMFSFFGTSGNRPDGLDTVIDVKHTVYAIIWLAVSQMIDPAAAEKKTRPQKFWWGRDIGNLTLVRGRSDLEMRVGDRVRLKDDTGAPVTIHHNNDTGAAHEVRLFTVTETQTTLVILWQDGQEEVIRSTEVIPYLNPDEPGDHVVWKGENVERLAIVQSVNATDRTARILLPATNAVELASLLELDPHSTSDLGAASAQPASEGLGVCRGDFVFIHPIGTTNGFEKPAVPRIGEVEPWARENPIVEGQLGGWRKDMADIGGAVAARRATDGVPENWAMKYPSPGSGDFMWLGEVTRLNLDGTVEITHPDSTVRIYPLERLTKLCDGMEQLQNDLWGDDSDSDDSDIDDDQIWAMDEDGVWQPELNGNEWEEYEDEEMQSGEEDVVSGGWADESMETSMGEPEISTREITGQATPQSDLEGSHTITESTEGITLSWNRFEVLSSAPSDHAFISSSPAQPSKSFLSRLAKEYRVLFSSLPGALSVSSFSSRSH